MGRTSDNEGSDLKGLSIDGWGLMLRLLSVPQGFNGWIYFAPVSGDDSGISMGPFMQTKYLCVLIHYIINDEVGTVKLV